MPSGAPSSSSVQRGGRRAAGRLGISAAYRTVGCENQTSATMLVHQGGASRAPLLVHVPRAYPRREPDSRSMHGEHSRTSLRRHARTSIITVLYTRTTVASYSLHLSHTILSS